MELITEYATPAELTGFARASLADREENRFSLARWLPNQTINDLEFRFSRGPSELTQAASFRAYDAETPIGNRPGVSRVTGELPAIGEKLRLTEYEQLRMRNLPGEITNLVFRDAAALARKISARMELARGDALVNGSVTIAENGVQAEVDFARSPSHEVTAAVAWTDMANSTPLDDMLAWAETYLASNGEMPGAILTSRRIVSLLMRNDQLRGQVSGANTGVSLLNIDQINAAFAGFGLPPFTIYDAQLVDPAGTTRRVIPDDRVIFLPAAGGDTDLGATLMGLTLEAQEPGYGLAAGEQPGIVVGNWRKLDPIGLWTHAAAIGLPILANPDLTFVADVA
jgi:hypothetical protein